MGPNHKFTMQRGDQAREVS
jgi:hypothetical protein